MKGLRTAWKGRRTAISVLAVGLLSSAIPVRGAQPKPENVWQSYANLPLIFEPNLGQVDQPVRFISSGAGYRLFLTPDGVVLVLSHQSVRHSSPALPATGSAVLRMNFVGANSAARIEAQEELPGKSNYLIGANPGRWHTNIPQHARVRYHDLYPGVDLVFYGNQRQLEYDLVVAPAADSKKVRFAFEGVSSMNVDAKGDLVLHTPTGDVVQRRPNIYQANGDRKTTVLGHYMLDARNEVTFQLGKYDERKPVIIDPVLSYSTLLGGGGFDEALDVAVDSSGHAYVAGSTTSLNFPRTAGLKAQGNQDVFVAKLNSTGTGVLYATYLGGDSDEGGNGIAVDSTGHAYVAGSTASPNFPALSLGATGTVFVSKLNATGSGLLYSVRFGGDANRGAPFNGAYGIAVDALGQAYVTGATTSTQFPTTGRAFQKKLADQAGGFPGDAFVSKLNSSGNRFLYSTYLGGNSADAGFGIALDLAGNAYVTGYAISDDFPTTPGAMQPSMSASDTQAFVTKLNVNGSAPLYSTYFGSSVYTVGLGIAVDKSGHAYITGETDAAGFPITPGAFQPACKRISGQSSCAPVAFASKLNLAGSGVVYSTFFGGNGGSRGSGIAVNSSGNAYVVGSAGHGTFPLTTNAFQRLAPHGAGFVVEFNSAASGLVFSSYLGGSSGQDIAGAIALGPGGAYVAGGTGSASDFPVTKGAFQSAYKGGGRDAFVAKIIPLCTLGRTSPSVTICTPASATVKSPFILVAGTTDKSAVKKLQVFLDGIQVYSAALSAIDVRLSAAAGNHRVTVTATDASGKSFWKTAYFTVVP